MSDPKIQIIGGHDWSDAVPEAIMERARAFDAFVVRGLPNEVMVQISYPGADKLGLPLNPKKSDDQTSNTTVASYEIYKNENGIRLNRFLAELTANGLHYERGRVFKKASRPDYTASFRFSRLITQPAPMPENVRQLLTVIGFDGLWLIANDFGNGMRRDCIVCHASRSAIVRGRQLAFDGETNGNYVLHKVLPTRKKK